MDAPKCEFIRISISQSDRIMSAIMNATTCTSSSNDSCPNYPTEDGIRNDDVNYGRGVKI